MGDSGTDKVAETLKGLQASASINGGVGTGVNASNTRIYGGQAQIDEAQTYNYHKSRVESAMKSLGTSERNDELTSIARDYNKNIQEMDSLTKAMEINQSRIIQAEKNVQESIHTTISLDDNLLEDFIVGAKKANPEMSDNQAKELFFRADRNSEEYKEAVHYVQAINRPTQSKLEKPQIDAERLKFNEENLENTYHEKEQIVQSKIDDTSEMIAQMSELFSTDRSVLSKHIKNIIAEKELNEEATCANFAQVQKEGNREVTRSITYYNLDMIISVGYRVKSKVATKFRKWATKTLRDYIVQGFAINEQRLKEKESQLETLKKAINLIERGLFNQIENIDQARQLSSFLNEFAKGFELLDD